MDRYTTDIPPKHIWDPEELTLITTDLFSDIPEQVTQLATLEDNGTAIEPVCKVETTTATSSRMKQWVGRKVTAVTASLTLLTPTGAVVGAVGIAAEDAAYPTSTGEGINYTAGLYPDRLYPPNILESVPSLKPEDVANTRFLLSKPENPDVTNLRKREAELALQYPNERTEIIETMADFQMRQKIASKYGLTVIDPVPTLRYLYEEKERHTKGGLDGLTGSVLRANNYLAHHNGITIDVEEPGTAYSYNMHAPSWEELSQADYVWDSIINIVRAMSHIPIEHIERLDIKRFLLGVQNPNTELYAAAYVVFNLDHKNAHDVIFNASSYISEGVVFHELGHHDDLEKSGGTAAIGHDKPFRDLSQGAPYGKIEIGREKKILTAQQQGFLTYSDYLLLKDTLNKQLEPLIGTPECLHTAASLEQELALAGLKTIFWTEYSGAVSVIEQKAEIESILPAGDQYSQALDPWLPSIREQVITQLTRLGVYEPRVERFFIETSKRPAANPTPYQNKCTQPAATGSPHHHG